MDVQPQPAPPRRQVILAYIEDHPKAIMLLRTDPMLHSRQFSATAEEEVAWLGALGRCGG